MTRRRLPIGVQTFSKVRADNCYYVDKTPYIRQLLDEGEHYFLSRPRRFGKSLFLDTLKELFEGNEPLFEGLAIHDRWDWSVRHPVLRLSFGSGLFKEPGHLALNFKEQLAAAERRDFAELRRLFESFFASIPTSGTRTTTSQATRASTRACDPPDQGGVQQGGAQPGGVRRGAGLTRFTRMVASDCRLRACPAGSAASGAAAPRRPTEADRRR